MVLAVLEILSKTDKMNISRKTLSEYGSVGRASRAQREGYRFESVHLLFLQALHGKNAVECRFCVYT